MGGKYDLNYKNVQKSQSRRNDLNVNYDLNIKNYVGVSFEEAI